MQHSYAYVRQPLHRTMLLICAVALTGALNALLLQPVHANPNLDPPSVPSALQVPEDNKVFRVGHAVGTQQYFCKFSGTSFTWEFFGPQATLFKDNGKQILTHFLSPNPVEDGTLRATWQDSKDSSTVWAVAIASSSDPAFVASGAIPWLLLEIVGDQPGPTGRNDLTRTTFIQRVNTSGGVKPLTGCDTISDIGKKALVPYTTDYFFYEHIDNE